LFGVSRYDIYGGQLQNACTSRYKQPQIQLSMCL
jgi:hypothetical protein